jgi:hypothetical protein
VNQPSYVALTATDTARRLDDFVRLLDSIAKETPTGRVPIEPATITELKDAVAAAREACDLVAGAYRRIDPTAA